MALQLVVVILVDNKDTKILDCSLFFFSLSPLLDPTINKLNLVVEAHISKHLPTIKGVGPMHYP